VRRDPAETIPRRFRSKEEEGMSYVSIREVGLAVGNPATASTDLLILGLHEGQGLDSELTALDRTAGGVLAASFAAGDFKGERNELLLQYAPQGGVKRILLVGLGKQDDLDVERIRQAAAVAARKARDLGVARATAALYGRGTKVSVEEAAQAFAEGALLGSYQYLEYRTKDREKVKVLGRLEVLVPTEGILGAARAGFDRGTKLAEAVNYVRTLASHPGNHATPTFLAQEAERIAKEQDLKCTVLDRAQMEKLGMGALLGVARGSNEPPRFILLEYDCGDPKAPRIAIVGKGLTFDSGGISIKPAAKMEEMKYDMCGGATVLGVLSLVRALGVRVNVVGAVPSTENLSGGSAYKPGDILRSYSGKTIEVQNCDAEGRLILADALSYVAKQYKPDAIIDLATLTGAVVIALGHYGAGLISSDDRLASRLEESSRRTGERLWRLPIWEEMNDHLKSDFADLKNIADGSAGAGTIVGGAFLSQFVDQVPWAHVDIAGTAWWEKDRPYLPKGPSGYGVRLITDLLSNWKA
jgi:leucyl aminopeptidase